MRNCPHCGKEIQDEAAFCRFCRQDVDPPLWLTSLQKCPYCAEWVERGIERCPLCGKVLITEEPFYTSEEADSTEILLKEVRKDIFSKHKAEEDGFEEDEPREPEDLSFQSIPRREPSYREPSSDPHESQEGLGVLRQRQREEIPLSRHDQSDLTAQDAQKARRPIAIPFGRIIPWVVLIFAAIAVVATVVYVFQRYDPIGALGFNPNPAETPATAPAATEPVAEQPQPSPTYAAATLPPLPTSTGTPGDCVIWSEVTLAYEGQQMCVYGIIKRRFRVDSEIPYMAIFSEEEGTFAIVDRLTFYTQFRPGDCIQAVGEVEVMRGVRPFIDAGNVLTLCSAGN